MGLGKEKVKPQTEDDLRAKNLEWECFKKKNEDWKEMLAYQKANPTVITLDGGDEKEEEKKGSLKKSAKKRFSKSSNSKESSDEKKRKGGREKSEGVKVKKTPELPRSPRKEGSVLHPFFRKVS